IQINLIDINDHAPSFNQPMETLYVSEGSPINKTFKITQASDNDIGVNSIQHYTLIPQYDSSHSHNHYHDQHHNHLHHHQHPANDTNDDDYDDANENKLTIRLIAPLDREITDTYKAAVLAQDGGNPARTGTLNLVIKVTDVNDNAPKFDSDNYTIDIYEDLPVGSVLLRVFAEDRDVGSNSRIIYIHSHINKNSDKEIFSVDESDGKITLRKPLDRETQAMHKFFVWAEDGGTPKMSAFVQVIANVLDVNDNRPTIAITSTTESGLFEVVENSAEGTFVAFVSVRDGDEGKNGMVACELAEVVDASSTTFNNGAYKLETNTDSLDREFINRYNVTISCRDFGSPSLSSAATVPLHVLDVNDNRPAFKKDFIEVHVEEGNEVGKLLAVLNAQDDDDEDVLKYSIEPHLIEGSKIVTSV
ncbi:hypothetical protein HELRODRAFT_120792, partial [Helobdella robusta]|uniref:Cadherin domain-containing protein n=1 Tax=Helobdella robusta TaxID=6412 RepID=T1EGQ7_HELRO